MRYYVAQLPGYSSSISQRLQLRIDTAVQEVLRKLPESIDFKTVRSPTQNQSVEFNCQSNVMTPLTNDYVMVSAACTGGHATRAAVGPSFTPDGKAQCQHFGGPNLEIEGYAICMRVQKGTR